MFVQRLVDRCLSCGGAAASKRGREADVWRVLILRRSAMVSGCVVGQLL